MNKHTFKQGDRVFGQICTGDGKRPGVFVKRGGIKGDGCIIRRDDGVSGIEPGLYWFAEYLTTHDTHFQVGDWVRYEKVDEIGTEEWNGKVGIITWVDDDSEMFPAANVDGIAERLLQANLVKIQSPPIEFHNCIIHEYPPQETKMVIQEKESNNRRVHYVKECVIDGVKGWRKDDDNRVIFYPSTHWEPLTEWVTIQVEKEGWSTMNTYCLVYGPRGTKGDECTKWRYPQ